MANFFAELKRRHIYRVAAAYAVVAWVLLQFTANVAPILDLPPWIPRTFLLVLLIGFPVVLVFAWVQQLAPETAGAAPGKLAAGKLDWFLAGTVVLMLGLTAYQLSLSQGAGTTQQQAGVDTARRAAASPTGAISVAVLPFTNLSGDSSQEFFSDGMTEEITTALAKVADLKVVARTSAYQFKGKNDDMRSVGQMLGATHLIEGSVRKAGTRVRITAQLIKTDDGTHIWTENYDRELTDVFAIQEDIATAIAGALRMPLGLKPGERLVSSRSIDAELYQQFLRAKALVRLRARGVPQAIEILEPMVVRNPDYAPAWAQLAVAYGLTPLFHRDSADELRRAVDAFLPKAEAAGRRAIQLDANLADGYVALSRVQGFRGKWLLAEELNSKALALDSNNTDALNELSNVFGVVGRLKEALVIKQQLRALEPFVPAFNGNLADVLWLNGQSDEALAMLKESPVGGNTRAELAIIYASMGHYSEAADTVMEIPPGGPVTPEMVSTAARLIRAAPAAAASPQSLPRLGRLSFVYLYVGVPNRALEYFEDAADAGLFNAASDNAFLWHPSYAPVRKTERFKAFMRKDGLVDYWRVKGWPELCHPTTGDDFVCS